jgi:methionyl-tRNA formyltransferase
VRVVFFGTPAFAAVSLEAILASSHEVVAVVAQPDRKAGRGMRMHRPETALLAEARGIPVFQPAKIRTDEFLDSVRALNADVGVVVAYGRILPASLLEIPRHGFLNVHASILPAYRGAAPIQRAIENGDTETGVSIMRVDEELDHGPVFDIVRTPIEPDERAPQLFERLARLGGDALVSVLDAISSGRAQPTEQEHERATIASKIEKDEGVVDWTMPAKLIYDRFRAFDPWPGVSLRAQDEMLRLVDIRPVDARGGEPGAIVSFEHDSIVVSTSDGALRLTRVQRPGKSPVSGADFARGRRLKPGSRMS